MFGMLYSMSDGEGTAPNLADLKNRFGSQVVDAALAYLTYKKTAPMPKKEVPDRPTLYIFRHGQSTDNEQLLFSGWRDPELTLLGKDACHALGEKLKTKKIDLLIASPLRRAIETMRLVMSHHPTASTLPIQTDPRITERSYGDWQGTSKLLMYLENPAKLEEIRRSFDGLPPNGESIKMVCDRVFAFCDEICKLATQFNLNVAISCHGNSIRGFRKYFDHLTDQETAELETPLAQDYEAYSL